MNRAATWAAFGVALLLLPLALRLNNFYMHLANLSLIFAIVVVGFNICFGDAGQISLGHAGFFAVGAYASGLATTDHHLPFLAGLALAAICPAILAVIVGLPCLRLQGHYLALATAGFGEIVRLVIQNMDPLTHGSTGLRNIPSPSLAGWGVHSEFGYYYLALAALVILAAAAVRIGRSRFGVAFKAVRDDELAARSSGINATAMKVLAFTLSAVYAGVGGCLFAHLNGYLSPDYFNFDLSILILIMLVVGGAGTIAGCVIGAILLTYLPEVLRFAQQYYLLCYGVGVVLLVLYLPRGIVGALRSALAMRNTKALPPRPAAVLEMPA